MQEDDKSKFYRKVARDVCFNFGVFRQGPMITIVRDHAIKIKQLAIDSDQPVGQEVVAHVIKVVDSVIDVLGKASVSDSDNIRPRRNSI